MIKKLTVYAVSVIVFLCVFALSRSMVFAKEINGVNYNDNDYNKIVAFLNQPSAVKWKTKTNAEALGYDVDDPETWVDVSWNNTRVKEIQWSRYRGDRCISGELDISNMAELSYLNFEHNYISSLNVNGCVALDNLTCTNNDLKRLDLSHNINLLDLSCDGNKLSKLDMSKNKKLERLNCGNNKLTELWLNTNLSGLDCSDNKLLILNVKKNAKLDNLDCRNNRLMSLNISQNKKLKSLECDNNKLTKLDVSKNPKLEWLSCGNNKLTKLDVSKNRKLFSLFCNNNKLTNLNINNNPKLNELDCGYNKITDLNVSKNKFSFFYCNGNPLSKISFRIYDTNAPDDNLGETVSITLETKGKGYVGAEISIYSHSGLKFSVYATPKKGAKFVKWTQNGKAVSQKAELSVKENQSYDLVANFK